MKFNKTIFKLMLLLIVMINFSQCSTTNKLQDSTPFKIGEVYFQYWTAGVKDGGSGVNLFIPITSKPNNIILDSVYFRGKQSKLETTDSSLFVASFQTDTNQKKDVIMSSNPYAEYGNKVPELPKKSPFKLKENECVISYKQGKTIKYYKISNITIKEPKQYPATNNKQ